MNTFFIFIFSLAIIGFLLGIVAIVVAMACRYLSELRRPSAQDMVDALAPRALHISESREGPLDPAAGHHVWMEDDNQIQWRYTEWDDGIHETLIVSLASRRGKATLHFCRGSFTHGEGLRRMADMTGSEAQERRDCEHLLAVAQQKAHCYTTRSGSR